MLGVTLEGRIVASVAVFELHVLDYDLREVDIGDVVVSISVHILTER